MPSKRILLIDDEKDLRDALAAVLRDEKYEVIEASNGEEGLAAALEYQPDLILLDVIMPKLDGFKVLERLRVDPWGKNAKVILLTVLEDMDSVSKAVAQGSYDYLVKTNWKLQDIVAKVKEKVGA